MDSQCRAVQILMITSSLVICLSVKSCDLGWFGSRCQFKCHCVNNNCSTTGDCLGGSKCAPKWFGQGCQYQDLLSLPTANVSLSHKQRSHSWLIDNDGRTCNPYQDLTSISVQWSTTYIFTWLQFQIKDIATVSEVEITFKGSNESTLDCRNKELSNLTARIFEIRCDVEDAITEMILDVKNILKLCSLYVNGGRNVALKQTTTQSEDDEFGNITVDLAVDGNCSAKLSRHLCTVKPTWNLTLDKNYLGTRFVIYSSQDELGTNRLGFLIQTFDANHELVTYYLSNRSVNSTVVDVINLAWKTPFRFVSIIGNELDSFENKSNITLCEVEIYAECVPGSGGLDCENCSYRCFQSSCERDGLCSQGCAGFRDPPKCITPCSPGTWGLNCKGFCKSDHCLNNICDKDTGLCNEGCDERSDFPICSMACSTGNFGPNCSLNCDHCEQRLCDRATTFCELSCNGYSNPPICTTVCNKNNWGPNCLRNCSFNCKQMSCDKHNGKCNLGCVPGYLSDDCSKVIQGYNTKSNEEVVTFALLCLLTVLILATLYVLSCSKKKNDVIVCPGRPIFVKDLNKFMKDHSQSYFETEFQRM